MTEQDVADALREDDPWIARYPTMWSYISDLLNELGMDNVDQHTLYELYANRITPQDAVMIWNVYEDDDDV